MFRERLHVLKLHISLVVQELPALLLTMLLRRVTVLVYNEVSLEQRIDLLLHL